MGFYAEDKGARFLIPLLLRPLPPELDAPDHWRDVITPYGYPSPLLIPAKDELSLHRFLEAFQSCSKDRRIISAFLRLHPLLPIPLSPLAARGILIRHSVTVAVDLSLSEEELQAQTRYDHRSGLRKLGRAGFQSRMDDWNLYDSFVRLYRETMARVSASAFYIFSDAYFEDLRNALKDRLHLGAVLSPDGQVCSAGLFTVSKGIVQYHLSGSAEAFRSLAPTKMLLHAAITWARTRGEQFLHLGGGVGNQEDALFLFKAGFSNLRAPFHTYRMILDSDRYQESIALWERMTGGSPSDPASFFPGYRR